MPDFLKVVLDFYLGHYMYIETTSRKGGDTARLVSKAMPTKSRQCFTFFYFMYGWSIGRLALLQKEDSRNETELWSLDTSQGYKWHQAYVDIFGWLPYKVSIDEYYLSSLTLLIFRRGGVLRYCINSISDVNFQFSI